MMTRTECAALQVWTAGNRPCERRFRGLDCARRVDRTTRRSEVSLQQPEFHDQPAEERERLRHSRAEQEITLAGLVDPAVLTLQQWLRLYRACQPRSMYVFVE